MVHTTSPATVDRVSVPASSAPAMYANGIMPTRNSSSDSVMVIGSLSPSQATVSISPSMERTSWLVVNVTSPNVVVYS